MHLVCAVRALVRVVVCAPACAVASPSFVFSSLASFTPSRPRSCPHMGCVESVRWGLSPSPWWTNGASCVVVVIVAVVFDCLGVSVGPVGTGGGATVMGWGGLTWVSPPFFLFVLLLLPLLPTSYHHLGDTDVSCLGEVGAGGGVWLKEVGGWVQPNTIMAVPLSRSRHKPKTNKTRDPWSRVRVFSGLKYLYLSPYPRLNPRETHGYTRTRGIH